MLRRQTVRMELPTATSELLALQNAASAELRLRLGEIFKTHRGVAFIARHDNLFAEHWTPELAAAGYEFEGFEVKDAFMVLHGVENACGFIYRISISFPLALVDEPAAVDLYFRRQHADSGAGAEFSAAPAGAADSPAI